MKTVSAIFPQKVGEPSRARLLPHLVQAAQLLLEQSYKGVIPSKSLIRKVSTKLYRTCVMAKNKTKN
jgi:hypothetical protein